MKTSKSPETTEVTPSKKILKQARLPFKLISEVSTSPTTPQTRKRKLSAADAETAPKIGRISKENDLAENTVVISDEESVDTDKSTKEEKALNPFVKLVDTAWKKKLQKAKKKKTTKKLAKDVTNGTTDTESTENLPDSNKDEVEEMDVDSPLQEDKDKEPDVSIIQTNGDSKVKPSPKSRKATPVKRVTRKGRASNKKATKSAETSDLPEVVVLEDSNPAKEKPNESEYLNEENRQSAQPEVTNEKAEKNNKESSEKANNENNVSSEHTEENVESAKSPTAEESSPAEESPAEKVEPKPITPKRSARNKAKIEEKEKSLEKSNSKDESIGSNPSTPKQNRTKIEEKENNLEKSNSKDESLCSNPSTPKQNRSSSITTSLDESLNASTASANLTPKQMQKKLESAKKREEREKEKLEREKKRQQEKEERAKQRQEKEEQRKKEREEKEEAKRREKEEKEEQRRKEKEEKDRQRELEKKLKEEKEEQRRKEREEKEEQRKKEKEARDEEKRKKQEALELEKQEQELKKKKAAEAFANFFVPKQKSEKDQPTVGPVSKCSVLSSFAIKSDMRLAPTIRVNLSDEKKQTLDSLMEEQKSDGVLYLNSLKVGHKPLSSGKTWPISDKDDDDDVMIVEDELPPSDGAGEIITCEPAVREKLRPKLLSFEENKRPPYWGTWRKKSANVKPRRPFGQDQKLDYEVDSDEEWEEEPDGESVDGSACGSDDSDADEYEVDNDVFVPHGYLSDEEATMDDDDVLSLSPETQKARLKHLEDEFESEMKKPTEKIKPRLYGLLWETNEGGKPEKCVDAIWNYFGKMSMIMNDPTPLLQPSNEPEEAEKKKVKKKKVVNEGEKQSPKSEKKKKPKPENKESKPKNDLKKNTPEVKKNQPGINSFLTKLKSA
ncbi:hypothetical protein ABMA28_005809 [Loxostege sticticalis]|uniref:Chromatin assembly factor 1 subunit A n=1 Tax=Loxostege sticticalis TaxID=481309 RepID=A0ABD0SMY4_LOXSC